MKRSLAPYLSTVLSHLIVPRSAECLGTVCHVENVTKIVVNFSTCHTALRSGFVMTACLSVYCKVDTYTVDVNWKHNLTVK